VQLSATSAVRQFLAVLLVGVVMLLSGAPCTAIASTAAAQGPAISAPADPCAAHHAAPAPACAQFACQHAADLGSAVCEPILAPSAAAFTAAALSSLGRTDVPPLPPPRLL
jgi:hypothetical protein